MAVSAALVWTPRPLRSWLDAAGTPQEVVRRARSEDAALRSGVEPIGPEAIARLAAIDDDAARRALDDLARSGGRAIVAADADYPPRLRDLCDAPPVVYVRGHIDSLFGRTVAIVGSRAATTYGRSVASSMSAEFGAFGACVVSGLARGIDAAAHTGALDSGTRTAAVIGSGLVKLYPPYHELLADQIVAGGGAILSEFPPLLSARAHQFPMRNRIVAALAQATIVVEAGNRSGALITARLADEIGRAVFALPGDVGRATSAGTNGLIKDGVPLVTSASDAARLLGWAIEAPSCTEDDPVDPLLALLYRAADVDELSARSGLDAASLLARLTLLEVRGLVQRLPGGRFAPVNSGRTPKRVRR